MPIGHHLLDHLVGAQADLLALCSSCDLGLASLGEQQRAQGRILRMQIAITRAQHRDPTHFEQSIITDLRRECCDIRERSYRWGEKL